MKYLVQIEIDAKTGNEVQGKPIGRETMEMWRALDPIEIYTSVTRRAITVIVDLPNEDAMFEALHQTWMFAGAYPTVTPVVTIEEAAQLHQRAEVEQHDK